MAITLKQVDDLTLSIWTERIKKTMDDAVKRNEEAIENALFFTSADVSKFTKPFSMNDLVGASGIVYNTETFWRNTIPNPAKEVSLDEVDDVDFS